MSWETYRFFFKAEDGIREAQESRGLGEVDKRQGRVGILQARRKVAGVKDETLEMLHAYICLLYTSDAADDLLSVDLGGRPIIKKKNNSNYVPTAAVILLWQYLSVFIVRISRSGSL